MYPLLSVALRIVLDAVDAVERDHLAAPEIDDRKAARCRVAARHGRIMPGRQANRLASDHIDWTRTMASLHRQLFTSHVAWRMLRRRSITTLRRSCLAASSRLFMTTEQAALDLAAFHYLAQGAAQIDLRAPSLDDVGLLLRRLPSGLRRWTWDEQKKTPNSTAQKWAVENEYHWHSVRGAFASVARSA